MSGKQQTYRGAGIEVHYDAGRCIHAAECVRGLSKVFDPQARPWIDADAASPDQITEVIDRCPTGALSSRRLDGGPETEPSSDNRITVGANGPLYLRGRISLADGDGAPLLEDTRIALCRCGASKNKPFCDGSHTGVGFEDTGEVADPSGVKEDSQVEGTDLKVSCFADGPFGIEGALTLMDSFGEPVCRGAGAYLCRCGASGNKPFCDGSHTRIGFKSDA